jgi:hypothetical protein
MEKFEPPPRAHQFAGQPVEELRMARPAAVQAEVTRCRHDSPAEVILPDPVGDDAGGERIGAVGDPGGEPPATFRLRGIGLEGEIGVDGGDRR